MDSRFSDLADHPANKIFQVVFFPDRIYHAEYLNATRSERYRYNVQEVRTKSNATILKGEVYFDGIKLCNFLRVEYRSARLVEVARERNRLLGEQVLADLKLTPRGGQSVAARVRLNFCPWIRAFQVELWETLEPPAGKRHNYQILDMMGQDGAITTVPGFAQILGDVRSIEWVNVSFRENDFTEPLNYFIPDNDASRDNFFDRNVQVPNTQEPSSSANTVVEGDYGITFQCGYFVQDASQVLPVRYRNAMMNDGATGSGPNNIVDMRWIFQQELGGSLVFFHEVTVPPGVVEGTHQHIGSEELYYIVEGTGVAYLGVNDDPNLDAPIVTRDIFGIGPKQCREVRVQPGSVIFTKSGGIHGIANPGNVSLKFVAFLYHSA